MSRQTNLVQIIKSEEPHSHINLRKKRVCPTSQFVQDKDVHKLGKRKKIKGRHNLVDRISALPEEILVSILSFLPLKGAGATSILSRRWRYVWASTMTLNFEVGNILRSFLKLERDLRDHQSYRYAGWVNRVLEQHRGQYIERFRACFFLDYCFKSSIDKWIQFAMEKKVQVLELEFFGEENGNEDYTFPHNLLGITIKKQCALEQFLSSAWENLHSDIPSLYSCGYSVGFKSLKVLRLRHVGVTEQVLDHLLSNCPVLERLSLNAARGLINLRVVGPSIALKHLVIKHCYDLKSIEICNTNIVSFIYYACYMAKLRLNIVPPLLLNNVPLIVEVSIRKGVFSPDSIRLPFNQLACCLSQLEVLKLDIKGALYNQNDVFPLLEKLKHLELVVVADYEWALHHLTNFLKASPYLQRLVLKLVIAKYREIGKIERAAKCPHDCLKVAEIQGYRAQTCCAEHVMYLIENAVALEKIVVDPVESCCWPSGMDRPITEVEEEVKGRDHAMQHLRENVPSTVEFVCR